jgi:hypothetical protein
MENVTTPSGYGPYTIGFEEGFSPITAQLEDTLARAISKYNSQAKGATAALGVSLAERRQAMEMMTARLTQIYRFTRAVARFKWNDAATELGLNSSQRRQFDQLKRSDKLRKGTTHFANNWLEFHFGWSPLIGDIGDAMETLVSPVPERTFVKASHKFKRTHVFEGSWYGGGVHVAHTAITRVTIGSQVRVSNPNLLLLNRLGVINPLTVIWEIVPWSFVVDWFVNVADFLEQFTEFAGLEEINPYYTYTVKDSLWGYNWFVWWNQYTEWSAEAASTQRKLGHHPSIKLKVRSPWNLSPTRGLTAASLLVQQGLGHPKSAYPESRVRTTMWPTHLDYFTKRK